MASRVEAAEQFAHTVRTTSSEGRAELFEEEEEENEKDEEEDEELLAMALLKK